MNPDDSRSDWEKLLQRARADAPPPLDRSALLHAVRLAHAADAASALRPATPGWADEFLALFGSRRALLACATLACLGAVFTSWQMSELDEVQPWADLLASSNGGEP